MAEQQRSPAPSTPGRARNMAAIRRRDTAFERKVRSLAHRAGLRFRVDMPIYIGDLRPIRPDIVFTRQRIAVFCDGCFWHGCPEHGRRPSIKHASYWSPKIAGNAERDARHSAALHEAGWTVLRFWEHDDPAAIATEIEAAVRAASATDPGR